MKNPENEKEIKTIYLIR